MTTSVSNGGLFGGFEGHRAPTSAEIDDVLRAGRALISLDTNVLLGLYRYSDERSASLRRGLSDHRDQLFVSHQVQVEFWRNRASVLADRARASKKAKEGLEKARATAMQAITVWAKEVSVEKQDLEDALGQVRRHFASLWRLVEDQHAEDKENYPSPADDPLVSELERLLESKVGAPLPEDEQELRIQEGQRRFDAKEPPGFCEKAEDKKDLVEGISGDYLVWSQTIDEARQRDSDVVLVTADVKDDWYWRERDNVVGPRSELSMELLRETGRRLFMITPLQLEERWRRQREDDGSHRAVTLDEVSVDDGELVDGGENETPVAEPVASTWNAETVHEAMTMLQVEAPVQHAVIFSAAQNGGLVDRATVYALGNYPAERMLRGFTRPVRRIARALQDRGALATDVPDLLAPRYDGGVQATAFAVPEDLIPLILSIDS